MGWNVADYDPIGDLSKGYNFGRQLAMDRDLAEPKKPGLADAQGGDPNSAAPAQPAASTPGPEAGLPDGAGLRAPQTANGAPPDSAASRAAVYRRYGKDAEADRMLQANAALGLTHAQTGEVQQRTKNEAIKGKSEQLGLNAKEQEAERASARQRITEGITAKLNGLKDDAGQPRAPTSEETGANRMELIRSLYAAGHVDAANTAAGDLKKFVGDQIETDKAARKQMGGQVLSQVLNGDFSNVAAYTKRFGYGVGGANISSIQPGQQPGTVVMTFTDQQGQKQKVMKASDLQQMIAPKLHQSLSDDAFATQEADKHLAAQIMQAKAAANAHNASAGASAAATKLTNQRLDEGGYDLTRKKALDMAYATPEDRRTPEQKALIQGYSDHVDDSRPARQQNNSRPQVKVLPDGSQTMTDNDGTVWQMRRGTSTWVDNTPGRAPDQRRGAQPAAPGQSAPTPVGPPAAGGNFVYVPGKGLVPR